MNKISRRELLRKAAMGFGAVTIGQFLSSCTSGMFSPTITPLPSATPIPSPTPIPYPDLAVARGGVDPEVLVRKAIAAVGGMERFVPKGSNVIVKPNICIPAPFTQGATTNPIVVGTLVKMAIDAGAKKVTVLDYPFGGPSKEAYEVSGIAKEVIKAGGIITPISPIKFVKTAIPNGVDMKTSEIYDDILKADVLINVPVAKNHRMAGYTLGLKNLMGLVANREAMHVSLHQSIADLNTRIKSHLTVIDCMLMMMEGGPTGGSEDYLKKMDTVIVSPDIVAADTYAIKLFGADLTSVPYIDLAERAGLGRSNLKNLKIEEIAVG